MAEDILVLATDVAKWFRRSPRPALDDVSIEIAKGQAIGVVGESGSGKSTLARILAGAIEASSGEVLVGGRKWSEVARRDPLRRTVQMVFQDSYSSLNPYLSALQTVAEVVRVWRGASRVSAAEIATGLLGEVGISSTMQMRRPTGLSGGQRQRVAIARALACEPSLLIADEPTSSLDVSVQAQILNLLSDLRQSRGLALLLVSHDLGIIRHMTEEALVMYSGRVVERGSTPALLSSPRHHYTQLLVSSMPGSREEVRPVHNELAANPACVFAQRCPAVTEECVTVPPGPTAGAEGGYFLCHHPRQRPALGSLVAPTLH